MINVFAVNAVQGNGEMKMTKEWVVQAELNGRFGAVRRSDANGTRRTFETREAAQAYCDERNGEQHG